MSFNEYWAAGQCQELCKFNRLSTDLGQLSTDMMSRRNLLWRDLLFLHLDVDLGVEGAIAGGEQVVDAEGVDGPGQHLHLGHLLLFLVATFAMVHFEEGGEPLKQR